MTRYLTSKVAPELLTIVEVVSLLIVLPDFACGKFIRALAILIEPKV